MENVRKLRHRQRFRVGRAQIVQFNGIQGRGFFNLVPDLIAALGVLVGAHQPRDNQADGAQKDGSRVIQKYIAAAATAAAAFRILFGCRICRYSSAAGGGGEKAILRRESSASCCGEERGCWACRAAAAAAAADIRPDNKEAARRRRLRPRQKSQGSPRQMMCRCGKSIHTPASVDSREYKTKQNWQPSNYGWNKQSMMIASHATQKYRKMRLGSLKRKAREK